MLVLDAYVFQILLCVGFYLREEPLMLAAHSSHPLTAQKQGVYLSDLVDQNLFLYPSHPRAKLFYPSPRAVFRIWAGT